MASSNFAVNDKAWWAMRARMNEVATKQVRVGLFDPELSDRAKYHEYGTPTIPARSFLRPGLRAAAPDVAEIIRRDTGRVLAGREKIDTMLAKIGDRCVAHVQSTILSNIPPGLSARTIARKGSNLALVDTGEMFDNIRWEIVV